jgi:hypothetical protein
VRYKKPLAKIIMAENTGLSSSGNKQRSSIAISQSNTTNILKIHPTDNIL